MAVVVALIVRGQAAGCEQGVALEIGDGRGHLLNVVLLARVVALGRQQRLLAVPEAVRQDAGDGDEAARLLIGVPAMREAVTRQPFDNRAGDVAERGVHVAGAREGDLLVFDDVGRVLFELGHVGDVALASLIRLPLALELHEVADLLDAAAVLHGVQNDVGGRGGNGRELHARDG